MTVRDWLTSRVPVAPAPLLDRLLVLLGPQADQPAANAARVLLDASHATLASLLEAGRHSRDGALDLLAADALMTYAFEHAAGSGPATERLRQLARGGIATIGHLAAHHG